MATRMGALGVEPHIIEAVLNHVSGHKSGVAGVYNRSTYSNQKPRIFRGFSIAGAQRLPVGKHMGYKRVSIQSRIQAFSLMPGKSATPLHRYIRCCSVAQTVRAVRQQLPQLARSCEAVAR